MNAARAALTLSLTGALTGLPFSARIACAQRIETTLDAGAMALRYADTLSTGAFTLSPHAVIDWGSMLADLSGTYSEFTAGGRSGQGALALSRFIPVGSDLLGEIGGFAGGSAHSDGSRTGEGLATLRLHRFLSGGEVFVGAGGGRTYDGETWRNVVQAELGSSFESAGTTGEVSFTPTAVNDSIRYTDAQGVLGWRRDRMQFTAQGGFRIGQTFLTLGSDQKVWLSGSMSYALRPRIALVAAGGTYPVNPTEGFPGGRFISLSVRLQRPPTAVSQGAGPTPANTPETDLTPAVTGFTYDVTPADSVSFIVTASGAHQIEITGDFTNWQPRRLAQTTADTWSIVLPVKPGKYQMNVRLDGGPWIAPPPLLTLLDEFGGRVGLLVVDPQAKK